MVACWSPWANIVDVVCASLMIKQHAYPAFRLTKWSLCSYHRSGSAQLHLPSFKRCIGYLWHVLLGGAGNAQHTQQPYLLHHLCVLMIGFLSGFISCFKHKLAHGRGTRDHENNCKDKGKGEGKGKGLFKGSPQVQVILARPLAGQVGARAGTQDWNCRRVPWALCWKSWVLFGWAPRLFSLLPRWLWWQYDWPQFHPSQASAASFKGVCGRPCNWMNK